MDKMSERKERIQGIVRDGMFALVMGLGHSLGIFRAFAAIGHPCTDRELADKTGLKLR